MNIAELDAGILFDQNLIFATEKDAVCEAREIGSTVLNISQLTIDFTSIERVPRYYTHRRENNAEHSFMLGLASMEIGAKYYPGLDVGLMTQFALVHDLVELVTDDVATFQASEETLQRKHEAEQAALVQLSETLPAYIADLLVWYEEQVQPEARLVRHIDKLLPYAVNTTGAGISMMREDYAVTNAEQMMEQNDKIEERYRNMFPEPEHNILRKAHNVLANRFALEFKES